MIGDLKPHAAYKDSGQDWLGSIPAHWSLLRAKRLFREVDERSKTGKEELLSVSHLTGVTPRRLKTVTMFMAEKGKGCYLMGRGPNDRRMRVAARKNVSDAVVAVGIPHRGRPGHALYLMEAKAVMAEVSGVRRTGSAALDLAWTAAGRFDAYWEHDIKPWDMAAGIVLVREAGGTVTDLSGGNNMIATGGVLAANLPIHKGLLQVLKDVRGPG